MSSNCLDAGVLSLYFMKNTPKEVILLMDDIKQDPEKTYIAKEILIEAYKHLCVLKGNDFANSMLNSFYRTFNVNLIDLTHNLIAMAGKLKCQHRTKLSYNDCIAIAISLEKGAILHTTERELPKVPHLRVKSYEY